MKRPGWPLYAQFLAWLVLNLVLLAALAVAFTGRQGVGLAMLLTPQARERAQGLGDSLSRLLEAAGPAERPALLAQFARSNAIDARLEADRGPPRGPGPSPGSGPGPPPGPGPSPGPGRDFDPGGGPRPPGEARDGPPPFGGPRGQPMRPPPDGSFVRLERRAGQYQLRIPLALREADGRRHELVLQTDRIVTLLRVLGLAGWLGFLATALVGSALLWWPFVYSITRRIGHLTRVTGDIAQGRLDRRTEPGRPDELGRLGRSINAMTARLQAQVEGQREFLMDVSHELASPLARVQVGLALAQQDATPAVARALAEVEADATRMAELLQDLLQFSRSAATARAPRLSPVDVRHLLETACAQEGATERARLELPDGLRVIADADLLLRALANLLRNGLRHGAGSPLEVAASSAGEAVEIRVADRGPGVEPAALARLGEAFYRPDGARSTRTGGFGLGLAIARRCIEGCEGTLAFSNRPGGGFEALIVLRGAPDRI